MSLLDYLVVLAVLAIALTALAILGLRRLAVLRRDIQLLDQRLDHLQSAVDAVISGASGMDRRTGRLEQRVQEILVRLDNMAEASQAARPYDDAIRLVRQGASAQRLVDELGLSRSEADLLIMLHATQERDA